MATTLADIESFSKTLFSTKWIQREGRIVPESEDVKLGNDAVLLDAAVLYADLAGSTQLLERFSETFAASAIKAFLDSACKVIKNNGGVITSFDGDRVMAVFVGNSKCSASAKSGLQISQAVKTINASIGDVHPYRTYKLDFSVGIDVGQLFVVRAGIRGANDLSWVGLPANYAAKLSEIRGRPEKVFITEKLFERLNDNSKYGGDERRCMWSAIQTSAVPVPVWGSYWHWTF